jgi:hypothetical protein
MTQKSKVCKITDARALGMIILDSYESEKLIREAVISFVKSESPNHSGIDYGPKNLRKTQWHEETNSIQA